MYYYKIYPADGSDYVVLKCVEGYKENSLVLEFTMKNDLLPKEWMGLELCVGKVGADDYLLYLVDRMYKIFNSRLDSILKSWQTKKPIEICNDCMLVVCICDIMNVLDNNEATMFSEKDLEKWLEKPENIVDDLCNEIINRNCDSYNEMLTSYINRGMED